MSRKLVSYRLADDLQQALKERASREGISATELVNRLLRQGLSGDEAEAPDDHRLSRLEQVLHQLEKRVDEVKETEMLANLSLVLNARLVAVEQKLEELTTGVEEGCQGLEQLRQDLRGVLPQNLADHPDSNNPVLDCPGTTATPELLRSGDRLVSLKDLRQLLRSDS